MCKGLFERPCEAFNFRNSSFQNIYSKKKTCLLITQYLEQHNVCHKKYILSVNSV